jgi:phosphatidylinositol glycan class O
MVTNPASGAAGADLKPNASKNGLPASGPRSPAAQSRRKQTGVLDQKALALEDEFKTKHLGVLGVLAWMM